MLDYALQPLKKYAQFTGRARRAEYWWFTLAYMVVYLLLLLIGGGPRNFGMVLAGLFSLGMLVPSLAVSFRRLHDTDRSAWWLLLAFLPLVGGIVLLVFCCLEGTRGPNRFGPDPKGPGADVAVFSDGPPPAGVVG